ncbi:MAG: hydrogenase iron-sulfur subunit [Chloroflexi bacterium]|nr:hydrogenase iron-sulfur subunit [Chloroflexota bacterium]
MYEPRIIAFLCTWCSYTGADSAGIARMKSPANIRDIRVPCSGRVSPELIMRAFNQGADGVLALGCHVGECHYDTGNHRAAKRIPALHALMTYAGLEPERLRLDWVSASEGERFSKIATEFTEAVRALGPIHWKMESRRLEEAAKRMELESESVPLPPADCAGKTDAIRLKARELLSSQAVECVIGYEVGPRGRTRPVFIHSPEDVERLVWNPGCVNNLTSYLDDKLTPVGGKEPPKPVAVVAKPCDSRAVNVLVAEHRFEREKVHVIGVTCEGVAGEDGNLQFRCVNCQERTPVVYDTLVGAPVEGRASDVPARRIGQMEALAPAERMEFWLGEFDRCIRCYACRQACPLCDCPVCLFERDDSLWVGMGIGLDEKRTFHLGRAYHMAGRCVGCGECERACPMDIPVCLLNHKMAQEIEKMFGHRAGMTVAPSPIITILSGEYKEG